MKCYVTLFFMLLFSGTAFAQGHFSTCLHGTRSGKSHWYGKANGGFELFTNTPIEELGCKNCHGPTNADGIAWDASNPYPGPSCVDCHPTGDFSKNALKVDQCYSCHGRQATEAKKMKLPDVHRDAGMKCWDCHTADDMHGDADGTTYDSMLEDGAIDVDCVDCHNAQSQTLPDHSAYDPHGGKLHCASCHAKTVISCYNCHFESVKEAHVKRAKQPINDFVLLVNREKDGKVYPASFQSLTYQGKSFVAFGPFTPHTIMKKGRPCDDCHENAVVKEYNATGKIRFATWNAGDSTLSWKHGVVPMPFDYTSSFRMDFLTYNGNTHDPAGPSKNWSAIGKDTWDGHQMFFATPLTVQQMAKLGFDTTLTGIESRNDGQTPEGFDLRQNFPNPAMPATTFSISLPHSTVVTLKIYNQLGIEVATVVDGLRLDKGVHTVSFNTGALNPDVYLYVLRTPEFSASRKMVILE